MVQSWWTQLKFLVLKNGRSQPTPQKIVLSRDSPTSIAALSPTSQKLQGCLITSSKQGSNGIGKKEQQKAFEEIKRLIMSEPVFRQPDLTKLFEVEVDASNYVMGAILMQRDEKNILIPSPSFQNPWMRHSAIMTYCYELTLPFYFTLLSLLFFCHVIIMWSFCDLLFLWHLLFCNVYCSVTHCPGWLYCPCDAYCSWDSIVLIYYKY